MLDDNIAQQTALLYNICVITFQPISPTNNQFHAISSKIVVVSNLEAF
jgi:hypothetical protein